MSKKAEMVQLLRNAQGNVRQSFEGMYNDSAEERKGGIICQCAECVIGIGMMGYYFDKNKNNALRQDLSKVPTINLKGEPVKDDIFIYPMSSIEFPKIDISKIPKKYQRDSFCIYSGGKISINQLNDIHRFTFAEIADIIEATVSEEDAEEFFKNKGVK